MHCLYHDQEFVVAIYIVTGLTGPYSVMQWGWVSMLRLTWLTIAQHVFQPALTSWQVGKSWFGEKLSPASQIKGYRSEQISRKLSPATGFKEVTVISRKYIALLDVMSDKFAIYTTAINWEYFVSTMELLLWLFVCFSPFHGTIRHQLMQNPR